LSSSCWNLLVSDDTPATLRSSCIGVNGCRSNFAISCTLARTALVDSCSILVSTC
jgi:hypothetical protein